MQESPKNTLSFGGQRCLITGGSRGLGRAIACALAEAGAEVAITYSTHEDDAAEAREAITAASPTRAEPLLFRGEVSDSAHVRATVKALMDSWGKIDALICCAGITDLLPISLIDEEDWDRVMDTNVKGAFLFSSAVLRSMIRAKRGSLLYVGNFSSERVIEAPVHYAASKSALRGMSEALAREVGRYGIRVNLLAPGLLHSGLGASLPRHRVEEYLDQCPLGRLGEPEELAQHALFLLSEEASFVSAAKLTVDGGA